MWFTHIVTDEIRRIIVDVVNEHEPVVKGPSKGPREALERMIADRHLLDSRHLSYKTLGTGDVLAAKRNVTEPRRRLRLRNGFTARQQKESNKRD